PFLFEPKCKDGNRKAPTSPKPMNVLLYNYTTVTTKCLRKAQERASATFSKAGLEVVWNENTVLDQGLGAPTLEEMHLILRILPRPRATLASPTALCEALPCGLGREGCIASGFLDRVQEFANRSGISPHGALG